ncbi:hypothetical protein A3F38_02890 [Candidatus Saccharibacteria bacterium RIFCSPHIGHO2_12_FULL_48_21]|nr:MAG: hypothetical protein A3F38_02890 [Candidatus Saccharibacteria bacterium RIFCSPHIGHO2_12_FULL_48_21]
MYTVYVLRTADNTFYIGHTADLQSRIARHSRGECRYTKTRLPLELIHNEQFPSRGEAMKRERYLKSLKNKTYLTKIIKADEGPIV